MLPANASDPDPVLGGPGLPAQEGSLRLSFSFVPAAATVAGTVLPPTEIRLGTEVRDFPFQATDSRLALMADVATDAPALAPAAAGLATDAGQHSWLASWQPRAHADGAEVLTGWSSVAGEEPGRATAVLSLPRGETVSQEGSLSAHRMRAEVLEALRDLPPGDWRFYAVGLAGAMLALGIPAVRRLREP
jgi:hypothetical protein